MKTVITIASLALALALAGCSHTRPVPNVPIPPPPPERSQPQVSRIDPGPYVPSSGKVGMRLPGEDMAGSGVLEKPISEPVQIERTVYATPAYPPPAPYRQHHPDRYRSNAWTNSNVLPGAVAGALIGGAFGSHGHQWSAAGRGALAGAGVGVILDVLSR